MMMFAVQNLGAVETIEQKFLEVRYTEMEVDSVHSTIDFARKNIAIHSPDEWPVIIRMARRRQPYIVREVEQKDIFDLHQLAKDNGMTHLKNASINWLEVKAIRVTKGITDHIEVKESYEEEYKAVPIKPSQRQSTRQKRATECKPNVESKAVVLKQAFDKVLPIIVSKNDLIKLCTNGAIPSKYHTFYKDQVAETFEDCLPEPDITENQQLGSD
jgi:hypothetical protein